MAPNKVTSTGESQPLIGNDCHLYHEPITNWDTPGYSPGGELDEIGDVSLADWSIGEVEIVTRASDWAVNLAGKMRAGLEFTYLYGADWTAFNALLAAFTARTVLAWWVADLPAGTAKAQGLHMPGLIVQFPQNQPVEDASMIDTVRVVPAYAINTGDERIEPVWMIDNGGVFFNADDPKTRLQFNDFHSGLFQSGKLEIVHGPLGKRKLLRGEELADALNDAGMLDGAGLKTEKEPKNKKPK